MNIFNKIIIIFWMGAAVYHDSNGRIHDAIYCVLFSIAMMLVYNLKGVKNAD